MIALYMDESVEGQIVRGLRARGINLLTAEEDGFGETPDQLVFDRANALGRVIFYRFKTLGRTVSQWELSQFRLGNFCRRGVLEFFI